MKKITFRKRFFGIMMLLLVLTGVPTDIIQTPFFIRMTPVYWWGYVLWVLIAFLTGFYIAHVWTFQKKCSTNGLVATGALGGMFAIACPICIPFLVLFFGTSAVMTYFAFFQPILGIFSVGLLAFLCIWRVKH